MIAEFVEMFMSGKHALETMFSDKHPESYKEIVDAVISILNKKNDEDYVKPDPKRIHEIDDGGYQGTLVYVIGSTGYQPSDYWYVKVEYGSCSGSDTLKRIRGYSNDKPTEDQVRDYMTLALHIVQKLKKMDDDWN